MLSSIGRDIRIGWRSLRRSPGFTLTMLLLLGLGMGAAVSIFSVVDALVLRSLPLPQAERVVALGRGRPEERPGRGGFSWPMFFAMQRQARSFSSVAAFHEGAYAITGKGDPEVVPGVSATANLFEVLGVPPRLGRGFVAGEDHEGSARVVVLSDRLWQRRFAGDPRVLGQTMTLDGLPHRIVGVARPGFHFPSTALDAELWTPVPHGQWDQGMRNPTGGMSFLQCWARLRAGVTRAQAQAELAAIQPRLNDPGRVFSVRELRGHMVGDARSALWTLFLAVGFVLLIACANAGNLLMARATVRQRELAVRAALGASRGQVARQLLIESALLALGGGALAVLVAGASLDAITAALPASLPVVNDIAVDGRVLAFAALAVTVTVLLFGTAPALAAARTDVQQALQHSGRAVARRGTRIRAVLLVAEISLAFVLLVGAGLSLRSFARVLAVDPGFDARNLMTASLSLPAARYPTPARVRAFHRELLPRLQALPGAQQAALAVPLPFTPMAVSSNLMLPGAGAPSGAASPSVGVRFVSPDYLRLMGTAVLGGRGFQPADEAEAAPPVAIVSQSLARQLWPDESALGKKLGVGMAGDSGPLRTVVGVVADVRTRLDEPGRSEVYLPFSQLPFPVLSLVIRAASPGALVAPLRAEVQAIDPAQPVGEIRTMEDYLNGSLAQRRLSTLLLALFAGLALVLATVGVYGVLSYSVAQRTRELGIRLALGAAPSRLRRMVVMEALGWGLAGIAIGVLAALALTRVLSSQLYGVSPSDPLTFASLAALVLAVAVLAGLLPARRATRVDPMITMRSD